MNKSILYLKKYSIFVKKYNQNKINKQFYKFLYTLQQNKYRFIKLLNINKIKFTNK